MDDLLIQLREKNIRSIEEVDYAILETSGKLSVFKRDDNKFGDYPLPLILDGQIEKETLTQIKKSENAAKSGHPIKFMQFMKYGVIIVGISLAISTAYIYIMFLK